jgi:hypothetical protein
MNTKDAKISIEEECLMKVVSLSVSIISFFLFPTFALSDVIVHDEVTPVGKEVMLKAEVKGKFFGKGGEIVEFFVNKKSIGKSLSGGDGFAFKQFIPSRNGMYQITVKSGKDEGKGLLLSIGKGSGIVFVDVEGSLIEKFSDKPKQGSQKAIKDLRKRFPIVLLHTAGFLSIKSIKAWLKENEFLELPLMPWEQGAVFSELREAGFRIKVVIGSPDVIDSAREYKPAAFSFEEMEDAIEVKDWKEIKNKLIDRRKVKGK